MNDISILTRELVAEYEQLTNRKITSAEYLSFREQAMLEINNGYIQNVNVVQPEPIMATPSTIQPEMKYIEPIVVKENVIKSVPKTEDFYSSSKEEVKKNGVVNSTPIIQHTTAPTRFDDDDEDENEDPSAKRKKDFFALIDSMDA